MSNKSTFTSARISILFAAGTVLAGCLSDDPSGIAVAQSAATTVKIDLFHRPLPEIPLPNNLATRFDETAATGRRINASMIAPTQMEMRLRQLIDQVDGFGIFQPITVPFTGPLDIDSIIAGHRDPNYATHNDVIYLINVDRSSPEFGRLHHLDVGNGNYPVVLERRDIYWRNDDREETLSLMFEEVDEDTNGNGTIDPGEDTDADGILDKPNYLPAKYLPGGTYPDRNDLAGRADALMTFYERQTNTLIVRPMVPLRERTTYGVIVTRRIKDQQGRPVGSPYAFVNHASQTDELEPLLEVLPEGVTAEDIAFAFSFTTQSVQSQIKAVREGLYGHGVQAQIGENFPAEVDDLEFAKDLEHKKFAGLPGPHNPYVLYTEQFLDIYDSAVVQLFGMEQGTEHHRITREAQKYVDFHVTGSYISPQLFERDDAEGNTLPLNLQSWPQDLHRVPATTRPERVYFWLVVPRKEVSARGQGKPAPVLILSHGYTSNRLEAVAFGAYLARHGIATLAIDGPSHGLGIGKGERILAEALGKSYGIGPFVAGVLKDRATDMNADGTKDSGGDYWTSYMFHTRDMVRQYALDVMQLIRIFRSFDGQRQWKFDVLGQGKPGVAGDFDGDGQVDVGGDAAYHMAGGSLGGIMSTIVGGMEPALSTVVPIAGASGLGDVGTRTRQGGVPEPTVLRMMGPLYTGTLDPETGETVIQTTVVDLNDYEEFELGRVEGVSTGDTMVVENLKNGERGCGYVDADGHVRAGIEADLHDKVRVVFYAGEVVVGEDCALKQGIEPKIVFDKFAESLTFQGISEPYQQGAPLVTLAEGLGLRRANPELRRFFSLAQLVIDPGDPSSFANHMIEEPLVYEATGEQTGVHALIVTTIGDMNVPASTGVISGRISGIIDYLDNDPRYGKSPNQVLIDTYVAEAVHNIGRFIHPVTGEGVHMDVDNFSETGDMWGTNLPRLDPPLRLGFGKKDAGGGYSAAIFPLSDPTGTHGFDFPGQMIDKARRYCRRDCQQTEGDDPCGCETLKTFDIGNFMLNLLGNYFASEGQQLEIRPCFSEDNCPERPQPPELREINTLP